jgi:hypothetical protein
MPAQKGFGGVSKVASIRQLKAAAVDDSHINSALHPLVTDRYATKAFHRNPGGFVAEPLLDRSSSAVSLLKERS